MALQASMSMLTLFLEGFLAPLNILHQLEAILVIGQLQERRLYIYQRQLVFVYISDGQMVILLLLLRQIAGNGT